MHAKLARSLKYIVLPGKPDPTYQDLGRYDAAFQFWRNFWTGVLTDVGVEGVDLDADNFMRHDLVTILELDGEIIGQHLYCIFDLSRPATKYHSFIRKHFPETFLSVLASQHIARVISVESLAVSPAWRSSLAGVSLGTVLCSLAGRIAQALSLDGMIAAARADVAASKIVCEVGAIPVARGVLIHGCPTDLVYWTPRSICDAQDRQVNELVAQLWMQRVDTTGATTNQSRKIAA